MHVKIYTSTKPLNGGNGSAFYFAIYFFFSRLRDIESINDS